MPETAERLLEKIPDRVRDCLDSWKFWNAVAFIGIGLVVLGLYVLNERQTTEAARRIAIQRASAQGSLSSCVNTVHTAPVVAGFLDAQRTIITNSILTTTAALQATPNDPLSGVRRQSLLRLRKALRAADALAELIASTTPTAAKCDRMAEQLGLPHPFREH